MVMNEKHVKILKTLLNVKTLPDVVKNYYCYVKKLADRKDIVMSDQVLLLIASAAEGLDSNAADDLEIEDEVITEPVEDAEPDAEPTPSEDNVDAESETETDNEAAESDDEKPEPKKDIIIGLGQRVNAFYDGNIISGTVNGSKIVKDQRVYSIQTDDDIVELPEKDIEVA